MESKQIELPKEINEFILNKKIGNGAFGYVYRSLNQQSGDTVAIKSINKDFILSIGKKKHVYREKTILQKLIHPNIIKLLKVDQDEVNLYFVFEFCANGDLFEFVGKRGKISERLGKIWAAELVNAIEFMQSHKIMHRDLKPQNMMLDENFHIKLIDFGDSKDYSVVEEPDEEELGVEENKEELAAYQDRRGTLVGTMNYFAPEMIENNESGAGTDFWALGCTIYKILTGRVPFAGNNQITVFKAIKNRDIEYNTEILSKDAIDLIDRLLQKDQFSRLGVGEPGSKNDMKALKSHPFFKDIDFDNLHKQMIELDPMQEIKHSPDKRQSHLVLTSDIPAIVCKGMMMKRNKWRMKQLRYFTLQADGQLKYYKDFTEYKGMVQLTAETKVFKSAKDQIEIKLATKSYLLFDAGAQNGGLSLEVWLDQLQKVQELVAQNPVNNQNS